MVKVSICVPAYKNPVGVERLLESIKVQMLPMQGAPA